MDGMEEDIFTFSVHYTDIVDQENQDDPAHQTTVVVDQEQRTVESMTGLCNGHIIVKNHILSPTDIHIQTHNGTGPNHIVSPNPDTQGVIQNGVLPNGGVEMQPQITSPTIENGSIFNGEVYFNNNSIPSSVFRSSVPDLSAHQMALLATPYKSRARHYRKNSTSSTRSLKSNSRPNSETQFSLWTAQNKLPPWARKESSDRMSLYLLGGVFLLLVVLAVAIPLAWQLSKDGKERDVSTGAIGNNLTISSSAESSTGTYDYNSQTTQTVSNSNTRKTYTSPMTEQLLSSSDTQASEMEISTVPNNSTNT